MHGRRMQLWCAAFMCAFALSLCQADSTAEGHLAIISSNFTVEVVVLNEDTPIRSYTSLTLPGDLESLHLREACPLCLDSYNQFVLSSNQFLIPENETVFIVTLINDTTPHIQAVHMAECVPVSVFGPFYARNTIFVQCLSWQWYHIGVLKLKDQKWSYNFLPGFVNYPVQGIFVEYYVDSYELNQAFFAYAMNGYLFLEGPSLSAYNFYYIPRSLNCAEVVRLTTDHSKQQIIMECSNVSSSDVINSIHVFNPRTAVFTSNVIGGISYHKCPIRVSEDDNYIVVFAEGKVEVAELSTGKTTSVQVQHSTVHDVQVFQTGENKTFAVYSTVDGVYMLNVGNAFNNSGTLPTKLPSSDNVCIALYCPLLTPLSNNRLLITFNHSIAIYSIDPPQLLAISNVDIQPSRFIFESHEVSIPLPIIPTTTSHPSLLTLTSLPNTITITVTPTPTLMPDTEQLDVVSFDNSEQGGINSKLIAGLSGAGGAIILVASAAIFLTFIGVKKYRGRGIYHNLMNGGGNVVEANAANSRQ